MKEEGKLSVIIKKCHININLEEGNYVIEL